MPHSIFHVLHILHHHRFNALEIIAKSQLFQITHIHAQNYVTMAYNQQPICLKQDLSNTNRPYEGFAIYIICIVSNNRFDHLIITCHITWLIYARPETNTKKCCNVWIVIMLIVVITSFSMWFLVFLLFIFAYDSLNMYQPLNSETKQQYLCNNLFHGGKYKTKP